MFLLENDLLPRHDTPHLTLIGQQLAKGQLTARGYRKNRQERRLLRVGSVSEGAREDPGPASCLQACPESRAMGHLRRRKRLVETFL